MPTHSFTYNTFPKVYEPLRSPRNGKVKIFGMPMNTMAIKYWEFEDAPLREKLKSPNVRELSRIYFENETRAYRFAKALLAVKQKGTLRLKDCGAALPIATWKRYLDFGVEVGILKHENSEYAFTDRYSKPFKNIATYIKAWIEQQNAEDADVLFATARIDKQKKRGGRLGNAVSGAKAESAAAEARGADVRAEPASAGKPA